MAGAREGAGASEIRVNHAALQVGEGRRARPAFNFDVAETVVGESRLPFLPAAAAQDVEIFLETAVPDVVAESALDPAVLEDFAVAQHDFPASVAPDKNPHPTRDVLPEIENVHPGRADQTFTGLIVWVTRIGGRVCGRRIPAGAAMMAAEAQEESSKSAVVQPGISRRAS
jgi:hypothetical protein